MAKALKLLALLALVPTGLPQALAAMDDPTRPPPGFGAPRGAQPQEAPLQVGGVFLMGPKPYALVNGMTVHPGDRLGGGQVERIDHRGVWLKVGGGKRLLELVPDVVKRPARQDRTSTENRQ